MALVGDRMQAAGAVRHERSAETMEGKARWFYSLSHFQAQYGEYHISVDIVGTVVEGRFPRPALNAVLAWYALYRNDFLDD